MQGAPVWGWWLVCGVALMALPVAMPNPSDTTIVIDELGNMHINGSLQRPIFLNGVDVLEELAGLRDAVALLHDQIMTTTTTTATPTSTTTPSPIVFSGSVSCNLSTVPAGVMRVEGTVDLDGCAALVAEDLFVFQNLLFIGGSLRIRNNRLLTNIAALAKLSAIGTDLIVEDNQLLANLDGFEGMATIGRDISLQACISHSMCRDRTSLAPPFFLSLAKKNDIAIFYGCLHPL